MRARVVAAFTILLSISASKENPFGDGGAEVHKLTDIDYLAKGIPTMILQKEMCARYQ